MAKRRLFIKIAGIVCALFLLSSCATTQSDWEKASRLNDITAYKEFIEKHPQSVFVTQAEKRIEDIEYERTKAKDTIEAYELFLKKYPKTAFTRSIKERIEELNILAIKKKEFSDRFKKDMSVQEWEQLISEYKENEFVKDIIPKLEDKIIEAISKEAVGTRFFISSIKPLFEGPHGKICFVGAGKFPKAISQQRFGEGVVLKFIASFPTGSDANLSIPILVTTSIYLKPPQYRSSGGIDFNTSTYSPGAIWEKLESVVEKNKINYIRGIHFVKGIRIGSLYEGDGNIKIDFVDVNREYVVLPGAMNGSIHRFIGTIQIGDYIFVGEENIVSTLTFVLLKDIGYVHLRGKGKVISKIDAKEFELGD